MILPLTRGTCILRVLPTTHRPGELQPERATGQARPIWCKGRSDAVDATGRAGRRPVPRGRKGPRTALPLLPATGVGDPGSFFKWWKEQTSGLGKDQIDAFRKTLENGCIGVVATYLGYTDPADPNGKFASQFTEGYKTFREAEREAKE